MTNGVATNESAPATRYLRKSFVYKIEPTRAQEQTLRLWLGICRALYNLCLEQRIDAHRKCIHLRQTADGHRVRVTAYGQMLDLTELKRAFPWMSVVNAQVLKQVCERVDKAWVKWLSGKGGFPHYKSERTYESFTYTSWRNGVRFADDGEHVRLSLTRIGDIRVRWSRPVLGEIKTVTIKREVDGWYVAFSCDGVPCEDLPKTGSQVALDLGIGVFCQTSQGEVIDNPRWLARAEERLVAAQQRLSRRKKGSRGREEARRLLAKQHLKVVRQRADFHHKLALDLVRTYDHIAYDDLGVASMMTDVPEGDRRLAREMRRGFADTGLKNFVSFLGHKANETGKTVVAVAPEYTTQECSACGALVPKRIGERWHVCPQCLLVMERRRNSAANIARRAELEGESS